MEEKRSALFWGLVVKPSKRYETTVQEPFRISMACLEPTSAGKGVTSVYIECDNHEEFIIANLTDKKLSLGLDLCFNVGEKVCFKTCGEGTVHLTGTLEDNPPFDDSSLMMDSMEEDESSEEEVKTGSRIKEVTDSEAVKFMKRKGESAEANAAAKKKPKLAPAESSSDDDDDDDDDEDDSDSDELVTTIDTTLGDLDDTENFAEEEESDDSDYELVDSTMGEEEEDSDEDSDDDDDDDDDDDSDEESEDEDEQMVNGKGSPQKKKVVDPSAAKGMNGLTNGVATPKSKGKGDEKTPKKEPKTPKQDGKTPKQDGKTPKHDGKTPKHDGKTPKPDSKTPKQEAKTPKQDGKTPKQDGKTPKDAVSTPGKTPKRTVKGGIQIEELREGNGPEAKPGKQLGMYYVGRLKTNNKQFDACQTGKPFKFKLGSGEVIKGWDVGLVGMKVGGKRRLTLPPAVAYGSSGAPPDIPPNSTLVFEVECKFVK